MVSKEMQQMVDEAREKGLWLYCDYQDLWFNPEELQRHWEQGRFCWGPESWHLCPPSERVGVLERRLANVANELKEFKRRCK